MVFCNFSLRPLHIRYSCHSPSPLPHFFYESSELRPRVFRPNNSQRPKRPEIVEGCIFFCMGQTWVSGFVWVNHYFLDIKMNTDCSIIFGLGWTERTICQPWMSNLPEIARNVPTNQKMQLYRSFLRLSKIIAIIAPPKKIETTILFTNLS